jgi:two-component system OmpR family sensor kinase
VVVEELGRSSDRSAGPTPTLQNLPADLPDGLQTLARGGEMWRLLVRTRSDGSRVAIGQPAANRDEIARDSALRTILPLAVLVPCLLLLVGLVVHHSFRPMAQLAARLDHERADCPETLPLDGMPWELHPFIASINRLLARVTTMMDQQRRFIADAAHELRTPVTALSLQAGNLDQADLSAEGRRRLALLQAGIHRTARLLDQLLSLARYEAGGTSEAPVVAFEHVVKQVVTDVLASAQLRLVDLGFERLESVAVRSDATALGVLVRNLIDNALRHSPEGGRIDLYLYREGERAVFRVEDMGPGIPDADLGRIFEPFFRGSQPLGEGSGLGLSIAMRIVANLRGSIVPENIARAGRTGLCITVALPATKTVDC